MAKPTIADVLPGFMLYIISIYQPCDQLLVARALRKSGNRSVPKSIQAERFQSALGWLVKHKYVLTATDKRFIVSLKGLRFLGTQRMAFPRDKFRLYSIHSQLKRRS